jgi:hypothetical protein
MKYLSDCCSAEVIDDSMEQWVSYDSSGDTLQQNIEWMGRCSSCYDINTVQEEEES